MKVIKILIYIIILTNPLFGQNDWTDNICGNYVLFNNNEKDFTLFVGNNYFSLSKHVQDDEKVINSFDNIIVIPDYEGDIKIFDDTLLLTQNNKHILVIKILDSLRLRILDSYDSDYNSDTLVRVSANYFIHKRCIKTIWEYSRFGGGLGLFLDQADSCFFLEPYWYFYDNKGKLINKFLDKDSIHPFTKYLNK